MVRRYQPCVRTSTLLGQFQDTVLWHRRRSAHDTYTRGYRRCLREQEVEMARRIVLNGMVETGAVIVPAPAMVAVGQTWLAAAIVGIALIASVAQSRSRARAVAERQKRLLSSAEHAWN